MARVAPFNVPDAIAPVTARLRRVIAVPDSEKSPAST